VEKELSGGEAPTMELLGRARSTPRSELVLVPLGSVIDFRQLCWALLETVFIKTLDKPVIQPALKRNSSFEADARSAAATVSNRKLTCATGDEGHAQRHPGACGSNLGSAFGGVSACRAAGPGFNYRVRRRSGRLARRIGFFCFGIGIFAEWHREHQDAQRPRPEFGGLHERPRLAAVIGRREWKFFQFSRRGALSGFSRQ
jgi:hypothetical protein